MHPIDWAFIAIPLLIVLGIGIYTQRYVKSVADFLSGGRLAGRYLLAVSRGEMAAGAAVFVASFEITGKAGFTLNWWGWINVPLGLFVAISGFVIYRYRETRAMTLAQFFEIRYSKAFRLMTGFLGFFAGIVNFGIIPAIGARFFVYFLALPPTLTFFSHALPTYIPVMAVFLAITVTLTVTGGLITVMMTDCVEGIISQVLYLVIIATLVSMFSWSQISEVFGHRPPGHSLLNPFDSSGVKDFNLWFVLMGMFVSVYGTMAWQNQSAFNAAALTAHESRMGGILGRWRESGKYVVVTLLGTCAVNRAWKRRYSQWDEVMPGKMPTRPYTEMMAWEHFLTWRANQHGRQRYQLIKALDPRRPVTVHGAGPCADAGGWENCTALDRGNDWVYADELDGVGCSSFPKWQGIDEAEFAVRVEFVKSAAPEKLVWLSEVQGGRSAIGFELHPPVDALSQQRWGLEWFCLRGRYHSVLVLAG